MSYNNNKAEAEFDYDSNNKIRLMNKIVFLSSKSAHWIINKLYHKNKININ